MRLVVDVSFLFLFCEHCVESLLWERARLLPYFCQLELLAGVVYRFFLKAFEEHVLEFIESLGIFFREFPAFAVAYVLLWENIVIEVTPHHELHGNVGSHKNCVHLRVKSKG